MDSRPAARHPEQGRHAYRKSEYFVLPSDTLPDSMAGMEIFRARTDHIFIEQFQALPGQAWVLLGTNRSGIDDFFDLVAGRPFSGTVQELSLPDQPGVVSFKDQQAVYESELKKDQTDFMDRLDPGTPARDFLKHIHRHADLIRALDMTDSLDKGYRQLSTGQTRKLLLLAPITKGTTCLMIQAPFDGLDPGSCKELDRAMCHLFSTGIQILMFVYNPADMPSWTTHLGIVADGRLIYQGPADQVPEHFLKQAKTPDFQATVQDFSPTGQTSSDTHEKKELVGLHHCTAGYGGNTVFTDLTLVVEQGDHTLITGPNGSGKSTLLQVITGDHPACYTSNLTLFGIRRGTGESIWEIKQHMGIVSPDLHRNFRVPGSVLACILSGLFDSIGLYNPVTDSQKKKALAWLGRLDMTSAATVPFRNLTYADQRLVLIARALIKGPRMLILDEPTQGLDTPNRMAVLDFLADVAKDDLSTILYVSHREDECRDFFVQHIRMAPPAR
ncbi:MAG: ATP-binding cassette domain-containing protein [Desulfotignum sp.]|nr:ATP-binding cassette domain-containing protein [Desulfotignum sp.]